MEANNRYFSAIFSVGVIVVLFIVLGAGCAPVSTVQPEPETENDSETENDPEPTSSNKLDLSDQGLSQVPQNTFQQTNLTELDLSGNKLTGAIPAEIRFLSKLVVLDLSDNAMTGVPAEVGQLKNLKTLDLSNNQLTGLPLELGQLTQLETLDLRGNNYSTTDLDQIREDLPNTQILVD